MYVQFPLWICNTENTTKGMDLLPVKHQIRLKLSWYQSLSVFVICLESPIRLTLSWCQTGFVTCQESDQTDTVRVAVTVGLLPVNSKIRLTLSGYQSLCQGLLPVRSYGHCKGISQASADPYMSYLIIHPKRG